MKELKKIENYYKKKLKDYGPTPLGVDWNGEESQRVRFDQLVKIIPDRSEKIALLDYGCGYGGLWKYLKDENYLCKYTGFDISSDMIDMALGNIQDSDASFSSVLVEDSRFDFLIASGIFNVKLDIKDDEWENHILSTLNHFSAISIRGFSFNCLTSYSDSEKKKANLYYADPLKIFDYCKRKFSKNVALLHDYNLYEFTILVRK